MSEGTFSRVEVQYYDKILWENIIIGWYNRQSVCYMLIKFGAAFIKLQFIVFKKAITLEMSFDIVFSSSKFHQVM